MIKEEKTFRDLFIGEDAGIVNAINELKDRVEELNNDELKEEIKDLKKTIINQLVRVEKVGHKLAQRFNNETK